MLINSVPIVFQGHLEITAAAETYFQTQAAVQEEVNFQRHQAQEWKSHSKPMGRFWTHPTWDFSLLQRWRLPLGISSQMQCWVREGLGEFSKVGWMRKHLHLLRLASEWWLLSRNWTQKVCKVFKSGRFRFQLWLHYWAFLIWTICIFYPISLSRRQLFKWTVMIWQGLCL